MITKNFKRRCVGGTAAVCVLQIAISCPALGQTRGHKSPAVSGCSVLPPIDPQKTFLANFLNPCYAIPMASGHGNNHAGDLNAIYNNILYHVTPGYELIVEGVFPNARYFSATVYDSHLVQTGHLLDSAILPLTSGMVNPFTPGVPWVPNQAYGLTVGFGSAPPTVVSPGCSTAGTTIDQNFMDASQIHQGLTWTGDPLLPRGFPAHQTGANTGGHIMLRRYADISTVPPASVIVRQLSDGCAISAAQAASLGILTGDPATGSTWMNQEQIGAHTTYAAQIQPEFCFGPDPANWGQWRRGHDYVAGENTDAAYVSMIQNSAELSSVIAGGQFIRMHFVAPTVPTTPCATGDCALTGTEQMRYFSLSFQNGVNTLASIKDSDFVHDPNGNVTLLIGLGTPPPSYVTPSNYYTYFDLSAVGDPQLLSSIMLRNILSNSSFQCSGFNVPYRTSEYNPDGGYMGPYIPIVDYPTSDQLPTVATPDTQPNTCAVIPTQTAPFCSLEN